jgi:hypothetical protein
VNKKEAKKTFVIQTTLVELPRAKTNKIFLVLFFKKELLAFPSPLPPCA